jgi:hypothetical protein
MAKETEQTEASRLLEQFEITDGWVFALQANPEEIVIDCAFTTFIAKDEWKTQPARIRLKDPSGCQLTLRYPSEHGHIYAGELGMLDSIEAEGPLHSARFQIVFSYGSIAIEESLLSIEAMDWDALYALHPWILVDRIPPGQKKWFEG